MARGKLTDSDSALHRVATVLEYAAMNGDKEAASHFNLSRQTVVRWRKAFRTNDKIRQFVTLHRSAHAEQCHKKASEALVAAADFIVQCCSARNRTPEMLRAVSEAARTMAQYLTLDRAIEGRLNGNDVFRDGSAPRVPTQLGMDAEVVPFDDSMDADPEA